MLDSWSDDKEKLENTETITQTQSEIDEYVFNLFFAEGTSDDKETDSEGDKQSETSSEKLSVKQAKQVIDRFHGRFSPDYWSV